LSLFSEYLFAARMADSSQQNEKRTLGFPGNGKRESGVNVIQTLGVYTLLRANH
jgi:hypothetical protein